MSHCTYNRGACALCGKEISNSGLAVASHNRMHVRDGLMTETPAKPYFIGRKMYMASAVFTLTPDGVEYRARLRADRACVFINQNGKTCGCVAMVKQTDGVGHSVLACYRHQWSNHTSLIGAVKRVPLPKFKLDVKRATC